MAIAIPSKIPERIALGIGISSIVFAIILGAKLWKNK
jgi:hypothetical protein